jgi:D-beta-D-heptose 7-phosphate kinase/D-beta-D-heptose 1-phosphate adenosyltransferase
MTQSSKSLQRWLRAMAGRRIGVVGDFMLDGYVWGHATRLSPEAAVPVVDFVEESHSPGGAGNVAGNLAALGARVAAFGVCGKDPEAARLHAALSAAQIDARGLLSDPTRPTTLKTRIIARHQQVVRVDRESRAPIGPALEKKLIARIAAALKGARGAAGLAALVISDYDKGLVTEDLARGVLSLCTELRVPVFVKPKWSMLATYPGATAVVLNSAEAGFLVTRPVEDDDSAEYAGAKLLEKFNSSAVVLTRGARGMMVFEPGSPRGLSIPALSQEVPFGRGHSARRAGRHSAHTGLEVFDVTGAGDTVLATLALAAAAGASIRDAAFLGNVAARIVVTKLGTATVSPAELSALLRTL